MINIGAGLVFGVLRSRRACIISPEVAMDCTRRDWLLAIDVARTYDPMLKWLSPKNKSPTFQYESWTGAVEHLRGFRSVVLRHVHNETVKLQDGWEHCMPSDHKKKWFFRVSECTPENIRSLLAQIAKAG
jgi:hypothetical protein